LNALISLLLIVLFSIIVNKIAAHALVRTGLSREVASFQAMNAFSGVGFTTSESEYVVNHPVRRRIIRILMLLGSAGLTSAVATLVLSFVNTTGRTAMIRVLVLAAGLGVLYLFASSKTVDRLMGRIIEYMLDRFTSIRPVDYEALLGVAHGYIVSTFKVGDNSWLAGKTLREARLRDEGVCVLGIYRVDPERGLHYIGAPHPDTVIRPGDELVVYGPEDVISNLADRIAGPEGDLEHAKMVELVERRREVEEAESGPLEGEE